MSPAPTRRPYLLLRCQEWCRRECYGQGIVQAETPALDMVRSRSEAQAPELLYRSTAVVDERHGNS